MFYSNHVYALQSFPFQGSFQLTKQESVLRFCWLINFMVSCFVESQTLHISLC